jgi:hypothetical protein
MIAIITLKNINFEMITFGTDLEKKIILNY